MAVGWQLAPIPPWHIVATVAAVAAGLLLLLRAFFDAHNALGMSLARHLAVLLASLLSIGLLTLAVWNPVRVREPELGVVHLAVVLDVSDSVQRTDGGLEQVQQTALLLLRESLDKIAGEVVERGAASIVTFRGNVTVTESSLRDLLSDFARVMSAGDYAGGSGSNIGAGLERAAEEIEQSGGRGAILLISDGHDTEGAVLDVAAVVARQGIPVTVLPINAGDPELAITSADLPTQTRAGTETLLRGVIYNRTANSVAAEVDIALNPGLDIAETTLFGLPIENELALQSLASGQYVRLRQAIEFEGAGLQYVDIALQDEAGVTTHRRRFFTHVERPIELLALGGDFEWVRAISPEAIQVTQMFSANFSTAVDLSRYDGVVISSTPFDVFDPDALAMLTDAVTEDGLGLMMINGDHDGADEEAPTVMRSYHETLIDAILPLSTEPRPLTDEPPTRNVVILLDTSGSMTGWQLEKATELIRHIVNDHLTRFDYLDFIIFGGIEVARERRMNDAGKAAVLPTLSNVPRGSSELQSSLALLQNRELANCGLIIISDGEISGSNFRPDCKTTVFAVNRGVPANSPLYDFADPFVVDQNFSPSQITIPYFEPEPRDKFFEPGVFTPLSMESAIFQSQPLPVPPLSLDGAAIAYQRDDAEVMAFRPKFVDPVLAFRPAGNGYVGVFTAGFTSEWLNSAEGQQALQEWMLRIVPYAARDRYTFDLEDDGRTIDLTLTLQNEDGTIPQVDAVDVAVAIGETTYPAAMNALPGAPATFVGAIQEIPRTAVAQAATLVVAESGADKLARPQRIPLLVPPQTVITSADTTEATSFGVNKTLLSQLSEISGGQYDPANGAAFFRQTVTTETLQSYWPWLALAGAAFYLAAIALHRFDK